MRADVYGRSTGIQAILDTKVDCKSKEMNLRATVIRSPKVLFTSSSFRRCCSTQSRSQATGRKVCAAAAEGDTAVAGVDKNVPLISSKETGPLPYPLDKETFEDVMGFKGAAPERVNGRVAMWAFLICSIQELTSGQPVLQQAAAHPIATTFLGLILSIASLAPKYISGVALSELHEAASKDGLPQALRFFNKTHELWLGRVAMLGLAGLGGLEVFLGHALFRRG